MEGGRAMKFGIGTEKALVSLMDVCMSLNPAELVVAMNVSEEEKKWIAKAEEGEFGTPDMLVYDEEKLKRADAYFGNRDFWDSVRVEAEPENAVEDAIIEILDNRVSEAKTTVALAHGILIGDIGMVEKAVLYRFGQPNSELIMIAEKLYEGIKWKEYPQMFTKEEQNALKQMTFKTAEIKNYFKKAIEMYGFTGWEINVSENITAVGTRSKNSTGKSYIGIPAGQEVNGLKLLGLIAHEIESHLRSSENCKALLCKLLGGGSPLSVIVPLIAKSDNERLYEGSATLGDIAVAGMDAAPGPNYVLAARMALGGSNFGEIGKRIFDIERKAGRSKGGAIAKAWITTYRVLRGRTNLRKVEKYAFTEDCMYLEGYVMARKLEESKDKAYLDFSCLTVDELDMLKEVGVKFEPKYPNIGAVKAIAKELLG